jgi:hypothetical protein
MGNRLLIPSSRSAGRWRVFGPPNQTRAKRPRWVWPAEALSSHGLVKVGGTGTDEQHRGWHATDVREFTGAGVAAMGRLWQPAPRGAGLHTKEKPRRSGAKNQEGINASRLNGDRGRFGAG